MAFAMPLRGSGCMPQTSRGCAGTGSSDSARVYWDVPKHATNEGESAMHVHGNLIKSLAPALIGLFCVTVGLGGAAQAQTPTLVQPWGLPPLPPGVGPVEKFADVSGTPQGQFLEGGAFDTHGNLWFVAIGSGWVSYLTNGVSL